MGRTSKDTIVQHICQHSLDAHASSVSFTESRRYGLKYVGTRVSRNNFPVVCQSWALRSSLPLPRETRRVGARRFIAVAFADVSQLDAEIALFRETAPADAIRSSDLSKDSPL
jgi:hypothetical protein